MNHYLQSSSEKDQHNKSAGNSEVEGHDLIGKTGEQASNLNSNAALHQRLTPHNILTLQRTIGNRAVTQLIQSQIQRNVVPPPPSDPNTPIEVTVIDDSDVVGWLAGFFRTGEVYMTDTNSMVRNVLRALGEHQISRLNILDHGSVYGIQMGGDLINLLNIDTYVGRLSRLQGHFAPTGFVHIQHCEAGQNQELVIRLAQAFGVPVYAGTGAHNPVYRFNLGDYVRGNPDGTFDTDVGRP